jgi:hypothetical protein
MAVSASSYFSNSLVGQMMVGSDIDIYEISANPKFAVGTGFLRADGNKYRYAHIGTLCTTGQILATTNIESSTSSTAMSAQVLAPTIVRPAGENLDPNKAGSRYMQINHTGANLSVAKCTADVFAGGYIALVTGSGSGLSYRIKGNSAAGTPAAGEMYIELYDRLQTPIDTTTGFVLQGSKYANLQAANGATQNIAYASGFATVGVTATYYAWVCTKGLTSAVTGVPVSSQSVIAIVSTNTAGSIVGLPITSGGNYMTVGVIAQTYSASTFCLVDATLE